MHALSERPHFVNGLLKTYPQVGALFRIGDVPYGSGFAWMSKPTWFFLRLQLPLILSLISNTPRSLDTRHRADRGDQRVNMIGLYAHETILRILRAGVRGNIADSLRACVMRHWFPGDG